MFVDTSALIAILIDEDDAAALTARIEAAATRWISPLVLLEATMRLSTILALDPSVVEIKLREFLSEAKLGVLPLDDTVTTIAIDAFRRYGKGRGHPAQLNLADCFSYACAKAHKVPLLYKGQDFAQTDLR